MIQLKDKVIVIVAQEDWGEMFVSKHHYALELARLGNLVYYVNGPDQRSSLTPGEVKIEPSEIHPCLFLVTHRFFYPYIIKFHATALHEKLVRIHIKNIFRKIKRKVDVVWSFDISNTMPLKSFPSACIRIFMPVDEPLQPIAIKAGEGADIIFSVTYEILEKYHEYEVPKHFINHGVSEKFIQNGPLTEEPNNPIRIGLSGNMLRPDIDHATLLKIIQGNSNILFDIWGTVNHLNSNLIIPEYASKAALKFVTDLSQLENVIMHGQLKSELLAQGLKTVDGFLICYDLKKDQSKGTNYHKVLEYLATGKVVIANNITTYGRFPGLVEMIESRENNNELPQLFDKVVKNIRQYNSVEQQKARIDFAKKFIYKEQIQTIENLLNDHFHNKKPSPSLANPIYNNA